jgi:hypothetical protein
MTEQTSETANKKWAVITVIPLLRFAKQSSLQYLFQPAFGDGLETNSRN